MLLVIDVGNTNTVVGLYDGDELCEHWRLATDNYRTSDELRVFLTTLLQQGGYDPATLTGCSISSVVPQLNSVILSVVQQGFNLEPVLVEPGVRTGLKLQNENPKEIGADRIVNAVAAVDEYDGEKIIIDFGTATTFTHITANAEYRGGIILPGIQLSADALFEHCAKLPRVEISVPDSVIGRDTVSNIRSGLTFGYAEMVDGLVRRICEEAGTSMRVIATGGLSGIIKQVSSAIDVHDPMLTMKGLKVIYHKNQRVPAK